VIRRFSHVRKRPELSTEEFLARWTGAHVEIATGILAKDARLVGSAATGVRVGA
jgi:hypothetical protein